MSRFTDRIELHNAIADVTGHKQSVISRVIDGLVQVVIERTLAGESTTVIRLGKFSPEVWKGRPKWVPNGPQGTGSVRVLQDRVKLVFTAAERTANAMRDKTV